ncbi:MAG: hypothetical protein WB586_04325, partial [Chthoniobacterales bacterium]
MNLVGSFLPPEAQQAETTAAHKYQTAGVARRGSGSGIPPSLRYGAASPILRTRRSSKTTFALRAT